MEGYYRFCDLSAHVPVALEQMRLDECNKIFRLSRMANTILGSAVAGGQLSPKTDTQVHKAFETTFSGKNPKHI